MAKPIDFTPAGAPVYPCDPRINTECIKTNCYLNGGPCSRTLDEKYALTDGEYWYMIAWFDVAWGGPKLHEERDEIDGVPYLISDPVLVCTKAGEMMVAKFERDPETGFEGWIEPKSSWVLEDVTHWAPPPRGPGK